MARTTHFGLEIPALGDQDYAAKLADYFAAAELTLGVNTNLILNASVALGTAVAGTLGYLNDDAAVVAAQPTAEIFGRLVLQGTMVDGRDVLCRLIGITDATGLGSETLLGETVYHHATTATVTASATAAARATGDGRLVFLPLGFAFAGGEQIFFNGILPLQCCPSILSGRGLSFKDGSSNPAGDWALAWDGTRCAHTVTVAAGEDIDLVFPFEVPADFGEFINTAEWAFRAVFKTTGGGQARVYAVVGTDGNRVLTGAGASTSAAFGELLLSMAALRALNAESRPGKTMYLLVRATATSAGTVAVESHALLRYFPLVAWYL